MPDADVLRRIARKTLVATGYARGGADAFDLAECCGIGVVWMRGPTHMMGRTIYADPSADDGRLQLDVAHEVAHALLVAHGIRDSERAADALARLLLAAGGPRSSTGSSCGEGGSDSLPPMA